MICASSSRAIHARYRACQRAPMEGSGAICGTRALQAAVIPAKAGIHSSDLQTCAAYGLDSRFRGNDRRFIGDDIPNDTTTQWKEG
jgi:hypothetical protein